MLLTESVFVPIILKFSTKDASAFKTSQAKEN